MEKIKLLLESIDNEISSIKHSLQAESSHNVQWELVDKLKDKEIERAALLSQVPERFHSEIL